MCFYTNQTYQMIDEVEHHKKRDNDTREIVYSFHVVKVESGNKLTFDINQILPLELLILLSVSKLIPKKEAI